VKESYKSLFECVGKEKNLVRLGVRLLDERYELLFYKKYGKTLDDNSSKSNLTEKERLLLAQVIKRKLLPNIYFIESLNLNEKEIEELVGATKQKIESLRTLYKKSQVKETTAKIDVVLKEHPKYLVKIAIQILSSKDRKIFYERYDKNLNKKLLSKLTEKEKHYINMSIRLKLERIINFLKEESKVTDIKTADIEKLKAKYYGNLYRTYKSLFSLFECSPCYVRLSFYFQTENAQKLLKIKYGSDLTNTLRQKGITRSMNKQIINSIIPKMKKTILFLMENNITEEECEYLMSKEGKNDLEHLIKVFNRYSKIEKYIKNKLNDIDKHKIYNRLIKKHGLEQAKLMLLFSKYEGLINIKKIGELLSLEQREVFDAYATYKLSKRKTRRT